MCESANAAAKTNGQFKQKYKSLMIRRGHKKAIIAVGHKLLRVIFSVLKEKRHYVDPDVNYEQLVVNKILLVGLKCLRNMGILNEIQNRMI